MEGRAQTVSYAAVEGVATITLNRPGQRNAVNLQMAEELYTAVKVVQADATVRVVVFRGAGPSFCAGADLKERVGVSQEWVRNRRQTAFAAYNAIQSCPKPCIAVAHGPVVGAGCEIATACDFIVASDRASFRYPEAVWGTVGASQRLPRIVGKAMAKELMFTGRTIDAAEALRLRLVNRVVEPERLEPALAEIIAMIVKAPPLSVELAKRCVDVGMESDLRTGIDFEMMAIDRCLADQEWKQGIEAFAQRPKSSE